MTNSKWTGVECLVHFQDKLKNTFIPEDDLVRAKHGVKNGSEITTNLIFIQV